MTTGNNDNPCKCADPPEDLGSIEHLRKVLYKLTGSGDETEATNEAILKGALVSAECAFNTIRALTCDDAPVAGVLFAHLLAAESSARLQGTLDALTMLEHMEGQASVQAAAEASARTAPKA